MELGGFTHLIPFLSLTLLEHSYYRYSLRLLTGRGYTLYTMMRLVTRCRAHDASLCYMMSYDPLYVTR
uniref:Uncharacterized protein n=1 Tax=Picea glauca TaxID=3330 RepID=A0A101M405_PICGL|nr:hypothetical protein ABT39_MTgene258 [Picea glauca]